MSNEITIVACCVICESPRTEWVEVLDVALLLCGDCLDGVMAVAVVVYDNTKPIKMAVDLCSQHAEWRLRLHEMEGFECTMLVLHNAIEDLIEAKDSSHLAGTLHLL